MKRREAAMKFKSRTLALLSASALVLALSGSSVAAQATAAARPDASTAAATHRVSTAASTPGSAAATCTVHSLPAFVAQGELAEAATVADVIEVECDPLVYGTGSRIKITASQLFSRCGRKDVWYALNPFREEADTPGISVELDADGNATVAVLAGPKCQSGESLVSAHMEERPFETFTTSFAALPPAPTPPGVYAMPSAQVEDAGSSGVATIIEAEFAGASEKTVRIGAEELFRRCEVKPHLHWIEEDGIDHEGVSEVDGVPLDNDGNGFVIVLGDSSCAPGSSLIEADLESNPFTTQTSEFTIQPPQPTAEPSFTIEKLQEIAGGSGGFTTELLKGAVGDTVDYEIIVTNSSSVALELSEFSDPHCDSGTIAGGPGSSALAPGHSAVYTCDHVLSEPGTYLNDASVTGTTVGGKPVQQTSNQVEVEAPAPTVPPKPEFTIEKLQRLAGSGVFTTTKLAGLVGEEVEYEIVVKNTGNVALTFSSFADPHCDSGTIAGGPGATPVDPGDSTTFTCTHLLASVETLVNVASVTGTPAGEAPIVHSSPPVEVVVTQPEPAYTVEKLQRIVGSVEPFTTAKLTAAAGETVEYEIVVTNTGNVPLTLSSFSDSHCDAGTITGGPGGMPIGVGGSTTFTCTHLLGGSGTFVNVATVEVGGSTVPNTTLESNEVQVEVTTPLPGPTPGTIGQEGGVSSHEVLTPIGKGGVLHACEVSPPKLHGVTASELRTFTVKVPARGIKRITFYLDGRKLASFDQGQAKGGSFSLKLNARKLSHGVHGISFKAVMISAVCPATAASRAFVHPKVRVAPAFTG
jgi:hypothetical protein